MDIFHLYKTVLKHRLFCTFLLLGMLPVAGHCFGREGNMVMANVAQAHLSPRSKDMIEWIFGKGKTLENICWWADTIGRKRPNTKAWHYIPIQMEDWGYDPIIHGQNENLVPALENFIKVMRHSSTSKEQKKDAIRWIIDLIGDAHQPMQIGENFDNHGKGIQVHYKGVTTNLHGMWDSVVILAHFKDWKRLSHSVVGSINYENKEPEKVTKGSIIEWVDDTHGKLKQCYQSGGKILNDSSFNVIPDSESAKNLRFIKEQLKIASLRLAALLNQIFESDMLYTPFTYSWSRKSNVYHLEGCSIANKIKPENRILSDLKSYNRTKHKYCPTSSK